MNTFFYVLFYCITVIKYKKKVQQFRIVKESKLIIINIEADSQEMKSKKIIKLESFMFWQNSDEQN